MRSLVLAGVTFAACVPQEQPWPCATASERAQLHGTIVYEGDPPGAERDSNFEVWVIGEPDWEPRAVFTRAGFDGHPSFAPDGRSIAFGSIDGEVHTLLVVSADGGAPRELVRGGAEVDYPVWNNAGIIFGRAGYGTGDHFLVDPSSGSVQPFDLGPRVDGFALSPDGTQVVKAIIDPGGDKSRLVVSAMDGTLARTLDESRPWVILPTWQPGGTRVAYSAKTGSSRWDWDVFLVDVSNGEISRVTDRPGGDWVTGWSPDGERLVVAAESAEDWDLYVVRPDGNDRLRLTCSAGNSRAGSWTAARWP